MVELKYPEQQLDSLIGAKSIEHFLIGRKYKMRFSPGDIIQYVQYVHNYNCYYWEDLYSDIMYDVVHNGDVALVIKAMDDPEPPNFITFDDENHYVLQVMTNYGLKFVWTTETNSKWTKIG